jgi:hypothetical protein
MATTARRPPHVVGQAIQVTGECMVGVRPLGHLVEVVGHAFQDDPGSPYFDASMTTCHGILGRPRKRRFDKEPLEVLCCGTVTDLAILGLSDTDVENLAPSTR